jgi:adhesin/invasin
VQAKDANGNNLTSSAGTVLLNTTAGTLGGVTDNGNGSYTATLTSSTVTGSATISGTIAGNAIGHTATVTFTPGPVSAAKTTISASPTSITANGTSTSTITVDAKDANGNNLTSSGGTVVLHTTLGTLSAVTDKGNGTYTATLTSSTTAGTASITGTIVGNTIGNPTTVAFVPGSVSATQSSVVAAPTSQTADGVSQIALTVTAKDAFGNLISGASVTMSASGVNNTFAPGSGSTSGSGLFTSTLASTTVQGETVTATISGVPVTTSVSFVAGPLAQLAVTGSGAQVAGTSQNLTITAEDANGNLVTSYTGTKNLTFSGALSSPNPPTAPTVNNTAGTAIPFGTPTAINFSGGVASVPGPAIGTTSIAGATSTSSGTTLPITVPAAGVPAGNTIIVTVSYESSNPGTISVGDNGGNIYTQDQNLVDTSRSPDVGVATYSAPVTTALVSGNKITVTFGRSVTTKDASAFYVSGLVAASPADQTTAATSGNSIGASASSGNVTITQGPELLVGAIAIAGPPGSPTVGGGYSQIGSFLGGGVGLLTEVQTVSANGTYSATATWSGNEQWAASIVTYQAIIPVNNGEMTLYDAQLAAIAVNDGTIGSSGSGNLAVTVSPAAANKLVMDIEPSTPVTAGALFGTEPAVFVEDVYGNLVTASSTVSATVQSGIGPLTGTLTAVASGGVATFSGLKAPTLAQTGLKLTFTDGSLASAVDNTSITVIPGPLSAAQTTISASPNSITADGSSTSTITVQAKDANGNNLTSSAGTVVLNASLGGLSGVTDNHDGTYTATLTSTTTVGTANITGTIAAATIGHPASVTFAPGPATHMVFSAQPSSVAEGADILPTVELLDQFGNVATGSSARITLSITPGTPTNGGVGANLGGTVAVTTSGGIAQFTSVNMNNSGVGYELTATASLITPAISPVISSQFTISGTRYSVANGNWNSTATWATKSSASGGNAPAPVPDAADSVIIEENFTVTNNVGNAMCTNLQLGMLEIFNAQFGELVFNSGSQLTVLGDVSIGDSIIFIFFPVNANGIINMTAGGNLIAQSFSVSETSTSGDEFIPGTGNVELTAVNTLPPNIVTSFNNLTIDSGTTTTISANTTISGALTLPTGAQATLANGTSDNAAALVLNGVRQAFGTYGSSASTAGNKLSAYFGTTATGILHVGSAAATQLIVTLPGQTFTSGTGNGGIVANETTGVSFNITLTAADGGNNIDGLIDGPQTVSYSGPANAPGGATPTYTTTVTFVNGQATLLATTLVDAQTVKITPSVSGLTGVPSSSVTVVPLAGQLVFTTQPSPSTVAGVAFAQQPVVAIEDLFGNIVTSGADSTKTIALTLTTGTGPLVGTASIPASGGVASFAGLNITSVGNNKVLTATAVLSTGTKTTTTSPAFAITFAAASKLAVTTSPSLNTVAGLAFAQQPVVTLEDAFGNTVTGTAQDVTLAIQINPGGGMLSGTTTIAVNTTTGTASFAGLNINKVGSGYTLTATGSTVSTTPGAVVSSAFNITVGGASQLVVTTSPSASTVAGVPFATQPVVTLEDASGNTVTGTGQNVTLAIQANPGGGILSGPPTVAINPATGTATFAGLSINKVGTGYTLTATGNTFNTSPGTVISAAFDITFAPASKVVFTMQPSASTVMDVPFAVQPVVSIEDQFGNVVTGGPDSTATITLTLTTGSGALGGTASSIPAASGVADFTGDGLNISLPGRDKVLTATATITAGTVTTMTSPAFTILPNASPTVGPVSYTRAKNTQLLIDVTTLLSANTSDSPGDAVTLVSVDGWNLVDGASSPADTNGSTFFYSSSFEGSPHLLFTSPNNVTQTITYVVADASFPTFTANNDITISTFNATGQQSGPITVTGSSVTTTWFGHPGATYVVQRSTTLTGTYTDVSGVLTASTVDGSFTFVDNSPPPGQAFYQLRQN